MCSSRIAYKHQCPRPCVGPCQCVCANGIVRAHAMHRVRVRGRVRVYVHIKYVVLHHLPLRLLCAPCILATPSHHFLVPTHLISHLLVLSFAVCSHTAYHHLASQYLFSCPSLDLSAYLVSPRIMHSSFAVYCPFYRSLFARHTEIQT